MEVLVGGRVLQGIGAGAVPSVAYAVIGRSFPGPLQARMMDKLSVVRSLVANDEHSDSYVMTGYTEQTNRAATGGQHPSIGSVISVWKSM